MDAHLSLMGFKVTLFNRTFDHIQAIYKRKGLDLESAEGGPHGFARLEFVTSDMQAALENAQVVMVVARIEDDFAAFDHGSGVFRRFD